MILPRIIVKVFNCVASKRALKLLFSGEEVPRAKKTELRRSRSVTYPALNFPDSDFGGEVPSKRTDRSVPSVGVFSDGVSVDVTGESLVIPW